jgi:subtilase family serine protease
MNKLEHLAASVSALALLSSAAHAAMPLPDGPPILTQEEIARLPVQRDMNLQREFYVVLKPEAASAANAVQAYFRGFGFATEYVADANAVKLLGSFFQAERAGNFNYVPGLLPITPLRTSTKPSFPDAVESAIFATTFNRGPVMQSQSLTVAVPTTMPQHFTGVYGLSPADYGAIYGYNNLYRAGFNGKGETVDIAACFGYNATFLANFATDFNLKPTPNVTAVTSQHGSSLESNLAVQRVYGTAPGAAVRMWFSNGCTLGDFSNLFIDIFNDQKTHPAAAFNVSFGLPELLIARSASSAFVTADLGLSLITGGAKQKVALFAPSGDDGDYSIFDHVNLSAPIGQADVAFFASDPNVIAVGGTSLVLRGTARGVETAWSGSTDGGATFFGVGGSGGSGGGISNKWPLPTWQKGVLGTFSQTLKNLPDVSFNAALNSPTLMNEGSETPIAGTSVASPTWAGTVALLQQAYQKAHHGVSMANWPAYFYNKTTRATLFTDITDGTNGRFAAGTGYDNVTGLGVPCFLHYPSPCKGGK